MAEDIAGAGKDAAETSAIKSAPEDGLNGVRQEAHLQGQEGPRAAIQTAQQAEASAQQFFSRPIEPLNYASQQAHTIQHEVTSALQANQAQAQEQVDDGLANAAANDPDVQKQAQDTVDNTPMPGVSEDYKVQLQQQMADMLESEKLQDLQNQEMGQSQ